jgi:hypothetical protein
VLAISCGGGAGDGDGAVGGDEADGEARALAELLLRAAVGGPRLELALEERGPVCSHAGNVLVRVDQGDAAAHAKDWGLALKGEGRAQHDVEVGCVGVSVAEDSANGARGGN